MIKSKKHIEKQQFPIIHPPEKLGYYILIHHFINKKSNDIVIYVNPQLTRKTVLSWANDKLGKGYSCAI